MLKRLELSGFKGFRNAAFNLGPLTLLVGANAAGKSNIRDALRILHGVGLGYSLAEVLGGKYGAGGIQQWRGVRGGAREAAFHGENDFRFEVWVSSEGKDRRYGLQVDVSDERLGPRVIAEELLSGRSSRGSYLYSSNPPDDHVQQAGEHQLKVRQPRGGNYRAHGKLSAFPSHTPVLSQFPHRSSEPKHLRNNCSSVLDILMSMRFLDLDPDAMREPSPPGQAILGDRGENLSSVLQAICEAPERKRSLLAWVRSLTPLDAADFDFKHDLSGRVLVYLVEANGQHTSAVSASDGTLRFLALVAALLSPDSGRIFFFEELDNGIHPTRLHLLLDLLQQACDQRKVQVVGTTHNPALLAFLKPEAREHAVLVYRPESAPDSRIRRILDLPDAKRVLEMHDLGQLMSSGWLENAAAFSEPEEEDEA